MLLACLVSLYSLLQQREHMCSAHTHTHTRARVHACACTPHLFSVVQTISISLAVAPPYFIPAAKTKKRHSAACRRWEDKRERERGHKQQGSPISSLIAERGVNVRDATAVSCTVSSQMTEQLSKYRQPHTHAHTRTHTRTHAHTYTLKATRTRALKSFTTADP